VGVIMGRPATQADLADERLYRSIRRLPSQLERARARVRQLEQQARRFGMHDLVQDTAP
jgi:hypothetical protein